MQQDVRWKQRFKNLERAYGFLDRACQLNSYDELQAAGLIQSFEFTFELSWKTLKDFLENQGLSFSLPREVIKQSFSLGLIKEGHLWIEMLEKRSELSHTYSDQQAERAVELIKFKYFPAIKLVFKELQTKCTD